jgi:hypothetical protein
MLLQIMVGGALLLWGRRLYWLLAGGAGFMIGLFAANLLLREQSDTVVLAIALIFGALGAVLAVVAQKAIVGLVGFVAGGLGSLALLQALNGNLELALSVVVFLAGGVAGALLLSRLFELGLIVLSALVGGNLLVSGLVGAFDLTGELAGVVMVVVIALGVMTQLGVGRRR